MAEKKYVYRGICTVILIILATASFFFVWYRFVQAHNNTGRLLGYGNLSMAAMIYLILFAVIGRGMHAFKIGVERTTNIVMSQVLTCLVVDISEIMISMAITNQWRYAWELFTTYALLWSVQSMLLGILVIPMIKLYRMQFPPLDLLEIYGQENGLYDKVNNLKYKYRISEAVFVDRLEMGRLVEKMKHHEAVLLNDLPSKQKNLILKACYDMGKRVYVIPKISDVILRSSEELNLIDTPMFLCRNREISKWQRVVKRGMDLMLSVLALAVLSPIFLITAWRIKAEDGGPVFFRQERCTEGGRRFEIIKFRSMKTEGDSLKPTENDDERITNVGKVIRAWRIDELPQLLNIVKGDMSIVGPRPERVEHVEKYTEQIPEFKFRLKMKGGLTGYAQVYGKYNTTALDKLKLDLIYITNYSLLTDIQIIFETVKILFLKESTEGFVDSAVLEEKNNAKEEIEGQGVSRKNIVDNERVL